MVPDEIRSAREMSAPDFLSDGSSRKSLRIRSAGRDSRMLGAIRRACASVRLVRFSRSGEIGELYRIAI
jgi:hypothetical protein